MNETTSLVLGIGIGLVFGFIIGRKKKPPTSDPSTLASSATNEIKTEEIIYEEEYKMTICVRTDLKMGAGKTAAQCGHAVLGAYRRAMKKTPLSVGKWNQEGQAKVVLRCANEQELLDLERHAKAENIPSYLVADAGRTQIAAGSLTVLAIGPAAISKVNLITGHLRLMN